MFDERDGFEGSPGTKEYFSIRAGELPNGAPIRMPVMVVSGVEDGPTLFVNACLHGDEVLGSDVVRRTVSSLNPEELSGRLITVPMANPAAIGTRSRRNISEMYPGPHDMNRVFPGMSGGIMAERLAAIISESFVNASDYAFDLHCASVGGLWQPYTAIPPREACSSDEVYEKTVSLARAFGTELVLDGHVTHGSFVQPALESGVVASMAEFGVANIIDEPNRSVGMKGLSNLLKHLGMIAGEPEIPENQMAVTHLHRLRTERGGYLIRHVNVGDDVAEGDLLAEVEDLKGEVLAEFTAPADGRICRVNTMGVVGTGDLVVYVGTA